MPVRKKLLRDNMAEKKKSKIKKKVSSGVAHIVSSFNNTIITISDEKGDTQNEVRGSRLTFLSRKIAWLARRVKRN